MAPELFLDTDVIIDFLIDREPHADNASRIFNLADQGMITVSTSTLSISNVHYIISKVVGDKKARSILQELLDLITILAVTRDDLKLALTSSFRDFEDATQHAVAQRGGVKSIITRNTKDYRKATLSVFSPADFIKIISGEGSDQ